MLNIIIKSNLIKGMDISQDTLHLLDTEDLSINFTNKSHLNKVKLITSIIFLNMSPLHDEKFSKMLWFKSIEMMYELTNK